jgi:hypothetical protein
LAGRRRRGDSDVSEFSSDHTWELVRVGNRDQIVAAFAGSSGCGAVGWDDGAPMCEIEKHARDLIRRIHPVSIKHRAAATSEKRDP